MRDDFKRLYRSSEESKIAGLCAGIGQYVRVDPVVVRLVWLAITLMTGLLPGTLVYLIGWILVPLEPTPLVGDPVLRTHERPGV